MDLLVDCAVNFVTYTIEVFRIDMALLHNTADLGLDIGVGTAGMSTHASDST
jgi:hypothetical protein